MNLEGGKHLNHVNEVGGFMKRGLLGWLGIIILIGSMLAISYTGGIYKGIGEKEAIKRCKENEECYIVSYSIDNTGLPYVIAYGEDKGVKLDLTGDSPSNYLGQVFRSEKNSILIYGKEKNVENKNDNPSGIEEIFTHPYTIEVEQWEMITPIYRDYSYSQHSRIFYPKKYIDHFDVEHGDFKRN